MLFTSRNEADEIVLLEELLDVIEVRTVGRAVDKLSDLGVTFTSDHRGRVAVLRIVADELRAAKEARDKAAAEEAERQRIEAERQQAEAREEQKRLDEEQAAARARTEAYQARVRRLEETAGRNVVQLEIDYRRHLRTQLGIGYSVQGQREQAERTIPLEELEAWVGAYTEREQAS